MPPTNAVTPFEEFDFSSEFLPEMDFGADFSFGGDSFLPEIEVNFFKESSLLGDDLFAYNDVSISHLVESIVLIGSPEKKATKKEAVFSQPHQLQSKCEDFLIMVQELFGARAGSRNYSRAVKFRPVW
jgi:hypothetical protein